MKAIHKGLNIGMALLEVNMRHNSPMNTIFTNSPTSIVSAIATLLLISLLTTHSAFALSNFSGALTGVTITDSKGTNSPPTASFNHTQAGTSFTFDASGSTDSDGNITEYVWDFGDGTSSSGIITAYEYFGTLSFPVTLKVSDNGGAVSLKQIQIFPSTADKFTLWINFQENDIQKITGFKNDWGKAFIDTATPDYGWIGSLPTDSRNRNNLLSPDETYDTFIRGYPNLKWEAKVPNGNYKVTVCAGDVSYPGDSKQSVQIEGMSIIDPQLTTAQVRWIEKSLELTVLDGTITVTFTGANAFTALCWIKIEGN